MFKEQFAALKVGDAVARIAGATTERCTITRRTTTQITLDNGERYTARCRVGDGDSSYRHRYKIEPWTEMHVEQLRGEAADALYRRTQNALAHINWYRLDAATCDAAYWALSDIEEVGLPKLLKERA